ncbi:hypothetical protein RF11_09627 [Thelohanellus kitauei]|uniref:Uncharacterized protein n=1 Tax=Thelohanellus kitauei TaxID=669202 RepID=A0A0C2MSE8_THEKT|nr:hypothetical protein RF11_09627 [Thelohanellus kitauei]
MHLCAAINVNFNHDSFDDQRYFLYIDQERLCHAEPKSGYTMYNYLSRYIDILMDHEYSDVLFGFHMYCHWCFGIWKLRDSAGILPAKECWRISSVLPVYKRDCMWAKCQKREDCEGKQVPSCCFPANECRFVNVPLLRIERSKCLAGVTCITLTASRRLPNQGGALAPINDASIAVDVKFV